MGITQAEVAEVLIQDKVLGLEAQAEAEQELQDLLVHQQVQEFLILAEVAEVLEQDLAQQLV